MEMLGSLTKRGRLVSNNVRNIEFPLNLICPVYIHGITFQKVHSVSHWNISSGGQNSCLFSPPIDSQCFGACHTGGLTFNE